MKRLTLLVVILMVFSSKINIVFGQDTFNMTEYALMPPLARLEHYDYCLEGTTELSYHCIINSVIIPNKTNLVWNIIEKFSSNTKQHYRHDLIRTGICLRWCEEDLKKLNSEELSDLDQEYYDSNYPYSLNLDVYNGTYELQRQYGTLANRCVNLYLRKNYDLKAYSTIIYCTSNKETKPNDTLDYIFLLVITSVVILISTATFYDNNVLNVNGNRDFYKESIAKYSPRLQLLLAFSIPRNWSRLVSQPTTEEGRTFRYVQGFRFITILMVIYGHTMVGFTLGFIQNPYRFEESYHKPASHLALNAFSVVQAFFSISGLLMGYQFSETLSRKKNFKFSYLGIAVIYRYLRLTPVYFFIMLFDATWLYKLQTGPGWKRIGETERAYCRKNMWTNLLYINNYVNVPEGCMPITWYLAVDMQMFVLGLLIMMLLWKYPNRKKLILSICLLISVTIPAVITYVKKFDGIFLLTPEDRRFINHSKQFIELYVPVHTNMSTYLFGICNGVFCHHILSNKIRLSKAKQRFILWGAYIAPFVATIVVGCHYYFYAYDIPKPSIFHALFSILTRNVWGLFASFSTAAYVLKYEKYLIKFLQMRIMQPLGRLTYCIYLCHFDLMRLLAAETREVVYANGGLMLLSAITVTVFAIVIALVLCLSLEFPVTALLKRFIKKEGAEDDNKNVEMTSENKLKVDSKKLQNVDLESLTALKNSTK